MVFKQALNRLRMAPFLSRAVGLSVFAIPGYILWNRKRTQKLQKTYRKRITEKCYFDIAIGNVYAGRIIIGLFGDDVPMTCENFIQLCKGFKIRDKELSFRGTEIFHIMEAKMFYGGDVICGNGGDRGMSIYGEEYPDENFLMQFTNAGDLACASMGKNCNNSRFMVTLFPVGINFFGRFVVFGTILKGMRVCTDISAMGGRNGRPMRTVQILQCGVYDHDAARRPLPAEFVHHLTPRVSEEEYLLKKELTNVLA